MYFNRNNSQYFNTDRDSCSIGAGGCIVPTYNCTQNKLNLTIVLPLFFMLSPPPPALKCSGHL